MLQILVNLIKRGPNKKLKQKSESQAQIHIRHERLQQEKLPRLIITEKSQKPNVFGQYKFKAITRLKFLKIRIRFVTFPILVDKVTKRQNVKTKKLK